MIKKIAKWILREELNIIGERIHELEVNQRWYSPPQPTSWINCAHQAPNIRDNPTHPNCNCRGCNTGLTSSVYE